MLHERASHLREVVERVPARGLVGGAVRVARGRQRPVESAPLVGDREESVGGEVDAVQPGGEAQLGEGGRGAEAGADGGQAAGRGGGEGARVWAGGQAARGELIRLCGRARVEGGLRIGRKALPWCEPLVGCE